MAGRPVDRRSARAGCRWLPALATAALGLAGCSEDTAVAYPPEAEARLAAINADWLFADMHAHPSRFHRANLETIEAEEIERYRRNHMNLVVANISSDMAYSGGYVNRDGTEVERGRYKSPPGQAYVLAADRLQRLQQTFERGIAVAATSPQAVVAARAAGQVAVLPALEGADALEGRIDNLRSMHDNGLGLVQLVHFRANEIGHIQTWPYTPGGLTGFGREVVAEANRLGIVIDLAHANTETIMDVLAVSSAPVIFSHGGLQEILQQDRALSDDEVRAIAAGGGIVGIWPNGATVPDVATLVDHIEHVIDIAGVDHVGIGSDLRGMSSYSAGFGPEAEFRAIAVELMRRELGDDAIGKVMGGNFVRVWQQVLDTAQASR